MMILTLMRRLAVLKPAKVAAATDSSIQVDAKLTPVINPLSHQSIVLRG
jgi:hypothetical protein